MRGISEKRIGYQNERTRAWIDVFGSVYNSVSVETPDNHLDLNRKRNELFLWKLSIEYIFVTAVKRLA